jgi:hypothetical protein
MKDVTLHLIRQQAKDWMTRGIKHVLKGSVKHSESSAMGAGARRVST